MTEPSTAAVDGEYLAEANRLRLPARGPGDFVPAASLLGVWLLIPLALGALAYFLIGLVLLLPQSDTVVEMDGPLWLTWLVVTLALQAGYWALVSRTTGLNPMKGMWALLPVFGMVPTWTLAREALRRGEAITRTPVPAAQAEKAEHWSDEDPG